MMQNFTGAWRRPLCVGLALSLLFSLDCATVRPYRVTNYFGSPRLRERRLVRVAVLPFENLTKEPAAAGIVAEEFTLQLGRTGLFSLIERSRIEELWQEQDLDTTSRFDQATAVRIGKMLGAEAVILGSVTKFEPHPQLRPDTIRHRYRSRHHDRPAPPVVIIDDDRNDDAWQVFAAALAVISIVGIIFLITRPRAPAAAVGVQARLVDVETGEVLWQAKDAFNGGSKRIQALVTDREDRRRLVVDIEYLIQLLCRELVGTILEVANAQ